MLKISFNKHGLSTGLSETGEYQIPEGGYPFRYKLVDGVVVDAWPDAADEEIMELFNAEMEINAILDRKEELVFRIKQITREKIESIAWKIERATEHDAINNTTTLLDVYAEREAFRVAGNAAETDILAAETANEAEEIFTAFRKQ